MNDKCAIFKVREESLQALPTTERHANLPIAVLAVVPFGQGYSSLFTGNLPMLQNVNRGSGELSRTLNIDKKTICQLKLHQCTVSHARVYFILAARLGAV
ncbi:MAG TPA: hypothetical protein VFQ78_00530 [Candidatus Udaeobacter sp.]|jgi:hypothetical protein|nr:hypothetical protein [Candidatus Udaeobacter sp.]